MKLRIVSDGTPSGTRVTTQDGELVEGVTNVTWVQHRPDMVPSVYIELILVEMDVVGECNHFYEKVVGGQIFECKAKEY